MISLAKRAYQSAAFDSRVETGDKRDLIVMMYDAALDALRLAREHLVRQEHRETSTALARAMTVLHGLRNSLDFDKGGAVAAHLNDFYEYFIRKLTAVDRKSTAEITDCEDLLSQVREAWVAISPNAAEQVTRRLFVVHG